MFLKISKVAFGLAFIAFGAMFAAIGADAIADSGKSSSPATPSTDTTKAAA